MTSATTARNVIACTVDPGLWWGTIAFVNQASQLPKGIPYITGRCFAGDKKFSTVEGYITQQGCVVDESYEGTKYQFKAQLQRPFPLGRRIWRIVLGIIATLGTCFMGLIFSSSIRALYSRHTEYIYVAVKKDLDITAELGKLSTLPT